jgi:transcriptional regulator with PAS, ATPase and Fis domain
LPDARERYTDDRRMPVLVRRVAFTTEEVSMKEGQEWVREFPVAVTVCDRSGTILEMNNRSVKAFEDDGGSALIGTNVLDCHPARAREILQRLLSEGKSNIYTIEKAGARKLIFQSPWYSEGEYSGLVEISIPLPDIVPHFVRDDKTT